MQHGSLEHFSDQCQTRVEHPLSFGMAPKRVMPAMKVMKVAPKVTPIVKSRSSNTVLKKPSSRVVNDHEDEDVSDNVESEAQPTSIDDVKGRNASQWTMDELRRLDRLRQDDGQDAIHVRHYKELTSSVQKRGGWADASLRQINIYELRVSL